MRRERVEAVADAIAGIGYDGIVAFDAFEPEYGTIQHLHGEFGETDLVQLLVTCATTQDFQLNGDAQAFWRTLTEVSLEHGSLDSLDDVKSILWAFMEESVNARLNRMKSARLEKLLESGFPEWFLAGPESLKSGVAAGPDRWSSGRVTATGRSRPRHPACRAGAVPGAA